MSRFRFVTFKVGARWQPACGRATEMLIVGGGATHQNQQRKLQHFFHPDASLLNGEHSGWTPVVSDTII